MSTVNPAVVRALEELLRRVLRAPHDVDVPALTATTQEAAERRRARRHTRLAALAAVAAALVLLGWFASGWA